MEILYKSVVTGPVRNLFAYAGWPTVCADENDVLYAVCSGHRMEHVCPFGKTLLYKSRSKGKSWSSPVIADDSYLDDRDAGILYLGGGKMLLTNFRHPAEVYEKYYKDWIAEAAGDLGLAMMNLTAGLDEESKKGGSFLKVSCDYGETWGEEMRVPVNCPHGPVLLRNGDILYVGKEMYSYGAEEPDTINAYLSKPDAIAFKKIGSCPRPRDYGWEKFHEPHCVQLKDGTLLAMYRAQIDKNGDNFTIYQTRSLDNGVTWSEPEATGICGSPPHLLRLRDGRVILSYARRMEPFGIYARVISEDGIIGDREILIDGAEDSDIGYPATAELSDGTLVTVAYKREISDRYTSIVSVAWRL